MNNLLSYCGLVDARISASEKDLPVLSIISFEIKLKLINSTTFFKWQKVNNIFLILAIRFKNDITWYFIS